MAGSKAALNQVDVRSAQINRFKPLLGRRRWSRFERTMSELARGLHGRVVWNVNSTARGGGVAELLSALIPYDRGAGIDERWVVIEGSAEFFDVTKKLHTLIHGLAADGARMTEEERRRYEETLARNAASLVDLIRPEDITILHDPQTAGLVEAFAARGTRVIWRSHVGVDQPNAEVRDAFRFLRPYVDPAAALVFSRRAYAWDGLDGHRVRIIAPCIDPFSTKNEDLSDDAVKSILHACGLVHGGNGEPTFTRNDGAIGQVTNRADVIGRALPADARIVLQVSRWDRLKDPVGVMESYEKHVAGKTDAWLVLAGPATTSVRDDPEQPEVLREVIARRAQVPEAIRDRIVLAQLPMDDIDENAAIVNALQRRADVVVQKSIAEGFGLTVAEAMWKGRPVVASRVGGIGDQIEDGKSGVLIDDPRDLKGFGDAIVAMLLDESRGERLSRAARQRIAKHFIAPRYLVDQAELILSLLD